MDLYCEYLVKKKSTLDTVKRIGLWLLCIILCILIAYLAFAKLHFLISATPILIAALIYGTVIYGRNFSLEYEYVFTNGVLDIDVIKGRSRRSNLISVSCRKIEHMEPLPKNYTSTNKIVNAIYDENRSGKYVATFSDHGTRCDLLFQPPEKLLQNMKKYNPRNINL